VKKRGEAARLQRGKEAGLPGRISGISTTRGRWRKQIYWSKKRYFIDATVKKKIQAGVESKKAPGGWGPLDTRPRRTLGTNYKGVFFFLCSLEVKAHDRSRRKEEC